MVHGHRQEEDSVAVISSRAGAEVLLHGLHNREQLLCEGCHIMKQHLDGDQQRAFYNTNTIYNSLTPCRAGRYMDAVNTLLFETNGTISFASGLL